MRKAGFRVTEEQRGLDHGAWVPLLHLRPDADIPVFQVSMPHDLNAERALQLGFALRPLRDESGVILGSGSLTHNLHDYFRGALDGSYAGAFATWVREQVSERNTDALLKYRDLAPHAECAHPTEEHFLPLLVAIGAGGYDEPLEIIDGGLDRVLSMDSFMWGCAITRATAGKPQAACSALL